MLTEFPSVPLPSCVSSLSCSSHYVTLSPGNVTESPAFPAARCNYCWNFAKPNNFSSPANLTRPSQSVLCWVISAFDVAPAQVCCLCNSQQSAVNLTCFALVEGRVSHSTSRYVALRHVTLPSDLPFRSWWAINVLLRDTPVPSRASQRTHLLCITLAALFSNTKSNAKERSFSSEIRKGFLSPRCPSSPPVSLLLALFVYPLLLLLAQFSLLSVPSSINTWNRVLHSSPEITTNPIPSSDSVFQATLVVAGFREVDISRN